MVSSEFGTVLPLVLQITVARVIYFIFILPLDESSVFFKATYIVGPVTGFALDFPRRSVRTAIACKSDERQIGDRILVICLSLLF